VSGETMLGKVSIFDGIEIVLSTHNEVGLVPGSHLTKVIFSSPARTDRKEKEGVGTTISSLYLLRSGRATLYLYFISFNKVAVFAQPGEGDLHYPVYFANRKLYQAKHNYTTIEREVLAMVYALQKFFHYLLGVHFQFYTDTQP